MAVPFAELSRRYSHGADPSGCSYHWAIQDASYEFLSMEIIFAVSVHKFVWYALHILRVSSLVSVDLSVHMRMYN